MYKIFDKNRLRALGFNTSKGKPTRQQAVALNKAEETMPFTSDVARADDIKLQEITKNAAGSMEKRLYVHGCQEVNNFIMMCHNIIQRSKYHKAPPIPVMLKVINANSLSCC